MTGSTEKHFKKNILLLLFSLLINVSPLFADSKDPSSVLPITITLQEAIKRSLIHNKSLLDAGLGLEDSKLGLTSAQSDFDVKITPLSTINYTSNNDEDSTTWNIGGDIQKKHSSGITLRIGPSIETGDGTYTSGLGFSVTIPLFRGLGEQVVLNNVYSSEYTLSSSYRSLHANRISAVLEAISSVYNVVREQQLVNLYKEQVTLLEHHLSILHVKEKTGIVTLMDIYRAKLRLKDVQQNLILASERVRDQANRLKTMIGINMDKEITVKAPIEFSQIKMTPEEAIKIAENKRVEIDQARADIQESKRLEAVAKHNTLPDVQLTAEYTRQDTADKFEDSFDFGDDQFSVQLSSSSDFFRKEEKIAWSRAKLDTQRKMITLENTIENIAREIRNLLNGLEKTYEKIELRKEQIHQASGKQELAKIKFKFGEADNFNLIEAQNELQGANTNYLTEQIQYIIDTYRLQAALGTLIDYKKEGKPEIITPKPGSSSLVSTK